MNMRLALVFFSTFLLIAAGCERLSGSKPASTVSPPAVLSGKKQPAGMPKPVSEKLGKLTAFKLGDVEANSSTPRFRAGEDADITGILQSMDGTKYQTRPTSTVTLRGVEPNDVLPNSAEWSKSFSILSGEAILVAKSRDPASAEVGATAPLLTRVSSDAKQLAFFARLSVPAAPGTWQLVIAMHNPLTDVVPGSTSDSVEVRPIIVVDRLIEVVK